MFDNSFESSSYRYVSSMPNFVLQITVNVQSRQSNQLKKFGVMFPFQSLKFHFQRAHFDDSTWNVLLFYVINQD